MADQEIEDEATDDPALARWLAEVRVDEAALSRSQSAGLRARQAEEATLVGVLHELAVRGELIGLVMRSGRQHRGHVRLISPDAVVLALEMRQWLVARLDAIAATRTVQGPAVPGESEPSTPSRFVRLATALAEPGDWLLVASGTTTFGGSLDHVGDDVLVLRLENGDRAYVGLASADEVSMRPPS